MKINFSKILSNVFLCIIFVLVSLIFAKTSDDNKNYITKVFYEDTFPFNITSKWYKKYFGTFLSDRPISVVSSNNGIWDNYQTGLEGTKFFVEKETVITTLNGGIVVYKGLKDDINTIIIQGFDGYDYVYQYIINCDFALYDYVNKNDIIGVSEKDYFILTIKKGEEFINFEEVKNQ